eukprot:UN31169
MPINLLVASCILCLAIYLLLWDSWSLPLYLYKSSINADGQPFFQAASTFQTDTHPNQYVNKTHMNHRQHLQQQMNLQQQQQQQQSPQQLQQQQSQTQSQQQQHTINQNQTKNAIAFSNMYYPHNINKTPHQLQQAQQQASSFSNLNSQLSRIRNHGNPHQITIQNNNITNPVTMNTNIHYFETNPLNFPLLEGGTVKQLLHRKNMKHSPYHVFNMNKFPNQAEITRYVKTQKHPHNYFAKPPPSSSTAVPVGVGGNHNINFNYNFFNSTTQYYKYTNQYTACTQYT